MSEKKYPDHKEGKMQASEPAAAYDMTFTPAQRAIIDTFSYIKTDEEVCELKNAISDYFAQKAQKEIDKLWDKGIINPRVLQEWQKEHMRTPYR